MQKSIFRIGWVVAISLLLLASCVGVPKSELTRAKTIAISKEQFAANPFGFELTTGNFDNHYKNIFKLQKYTLTNPTNNNIDTIYRFHKGKTEMIFYKPMKLNARLVGGNIYRSTVKLKNEISVGISRKEFFWKFSDWLYDSSESLVLESPETGSVFTFVFARDKLKTIRIASKQYK